MQQTIVLFGEAEKGAFKTPHIFHRLPQLFDHLGNPPLESDGLCFAVQALLYKREVIYFRVEEEGFSIDDYVFGLKTLENKEKMKMVHALCLPGVGDPEILALTKSVCYMHNSILITNQKDLYDFLTAKPF